MTSLWILLIIELEIIKVENFLIENDTYTDDVVISVDEDGTYNVEDYHIQPDDHNFEEYSTHDESEGKSRLLDFEETYVKPNIKHNLKLYRNYKRQKKKRQPEVESDGDYTFRYQKDEVTEAAYDYDRFKQEYDHDVEELKKFQAKLNQTEFETIPKPQCTGFFNKGPFTMICLIREYSQGETKAIQDEAKESIVELLKLWGILLLIFIIIGWGHYGFCNWICPTKHCFPEDGYEEIKHKLALNPPGTLTNKIIPKSGDESKAVFQKEYYEPSETEYYLYNSLWNDIYHV